MRYEGKNVVIAECIVWKGEKSFLATLDQIVSYLSWRDTSRGRAGNRGSGSSGEVERRLTVRNDATRDAQEGIHQCPELVILLHSRASFRD